MRDYKNLVPIHYAANNAAKPKLAAKKTARMSKSKLSENSFMGYQFKFYLTIFLLIGATAIYVRHQALHDPKSVFAEIWKLYEKHIPEISLTSGLDQKEERKKRSAEAKKNQAQREKTSNRKNEISQSHLFSASLYQMTLKGDAATMVPIPIQIKSRPERYFGNLIHQLIRYDSKNRSTINSFDKQVVLKDTRVENDVLLLDFNRAFEYNRFGYMGLSTQIQQVLWTIFKSPIAKKEGIRSVAFLIEGERKKKIGGEGMELKLFYTHRDLRSKVRMKSHT